MGSIFDFDIDALEPKRLLRIIEQSTSFGDYVYNGVTKPKYFTVHHHRNGGYYDIKNHKLVVGYDAYKLFDWRHLESRYVELKKLYAQANTKYHDFIKTLVDTGIASGASETWIPRGNDNKYYYVIRHDRPTMIHYSTFEEIYSDCKSSVTKRGYHVRGEELAMHNRFESIANTIRNRMFTYHSAFKEAVALRVEPWFEEIRNEHEYFDGTILIHNENRMYILSYESYVLKWRESDVYKTPDNPR